MKKISSCLISIIFFSGLSLNTASALEKHSPHASPNYFNEIQFCKHSLQGEIFLKTELFFGFSRSNGPDVTEEEFQRFVDTKVTPRFPDGLTLIYAKGRFKDSTGNVIQEGSKLLILLHPFSNERNLAVEQIRTDYKKEFQQESVLRVDEQSCVSF